MKTHKIATYVFLVSLFAILVEKSNAQKNSLSQPQIEIVAFPNPFNQGVSLEIISLYARATELKVFDIIGKECQKIELTQFANTGIYRVQLQELPAGVYFCNLYSDKKLLGSKKIVSIP